MWNIVIRKITKQASKKVYVTHYPLYCNGGTFLFVVVYYDTKKVRHDGYGSIF